MKASIIAARERVQSALNCNKTAARKWCADALHTTERAFRRWETGDRKMHPATFELLQIKVEGLRDESTND